MVKIALDATYAADPEPTGIGIYSQRLIASLAASEFLHETENRLVLCFRWGPYFRWARKRAWPPGCSISPLHDSFPLRLPSRRGIDIFHGLNQRLPETLYDHSVVTIHDLFPMTSTEYSTPEFQRRFTEILHKAISRADRIIAVSDATRQQLLLHTDAVDSRIHVVHHGIDRPRMTSQAEREEFRSRVLALGPREKFLLNVGTIQVRKNVANIILAAKQVPDCRLVLAGGEGFGAEHILPLIEKEGMAGRVIRLGHASMDALRLLYSTATALVFPSFEEGFGFPIIEAMSYGLPVITSNCSSMPEVAGDAALHVDPNDVSQITDAMRRVVEDEALAADLRRKGMERANLFSWEKCARETWKVYEESLERRREE